MIPLCHQNTDGRMVLAIAGEYNHAALTADRIEKEVGSWGLKDSERFVKQVLEETREAVNDITPSEQAHQHIKKDIISFTESLLTGKSAGKISNLHEKE